MPAKKKSVTTPLHLLQQLSHSLIEHLDKACSQAIKDAEGALAKLQKQRGKAQDKLTKARAKLDEAGSLGESMALAIAQRLPVAYLADGPRIPDDLQVARSHQLVSRAVSLQAPEEPSEDAMAEMFAGLYQQPARRAG